MIDLAIWGASGHAKVVIDAVRLDGRFRPIVLLDDRAPSDRPAEFEGIHVVDAKSSLATLRADGVRHMIIAFGACAAQMAAAEQAIAAGFDLASIVHPSAIVAGSARIGDGTFVAAGAIINPGTTIGRAVIVNTRATIDHDCTIGDGAHICPGVTLAGGVTIGRLSWIGVGSVVSNDVTVGSGSIIGAGATVVAAIPDGVVAYGTPARVVKPVDANDRLVRING